MAPPSKQNSKQPKTQNTATSVARRKVRRKPKQPDPAYVHVSWWSMLVVVLVSGGFGLYLGRLYRIIAFRNLQVTQVKWVRSSIIPRVRSFLNATTTTTTTTTTTETHTDHQGLSQLRLQQRLQQQTELLLQPVLFTHPNPQKVAIVVAGKNNNNKNNLHQHFPRRRENDDDEEEEDFVVGWFVSQIQRHKPIQEIWVASAVSSSSVSFQLVVEQAGDVKTNDVDDSDDDDSDDDDDDEEAEEDQCEVSPSKNDEATKGPLDVVIIVDWIVQGEEEEEDSTPDYWYGRLSQDGILVLPLSKTSMERIEQIDRLVSAGFEYILDYDLPSSMPLVFNNNNNNNNFAVAFKSGKTRARWRMTEANYNLEILRRIVLDENQDEKNEFKTKYPFVYFDSAAMLPIQYPPRWSEDVYCLNDPHVSGPCQDILFDPSIPNIPYGSLIVQKSKVGENAGRGVFTTVDVSGEAYIGLDGSPYPVRCDWKTWKIIETMDVNSIIYDNADVSIAAVYLESYGFMDEIHGEPQFLVDSGVLTFMNHGCNSTNNIGIKTEWNEQNVDTEEGTIPDVFRTFQAAYDPPFERTAHLDAWTSQCFEGFIQAGSELLDNYLFFGGEDLFHVNAEDLRAECSGAFGMVEEYQSSYAKP